MEVDYKVKLEVFEGPLDLLLYLIKRDEVDIYEISIERRSEEHTSELQSHSDLHAFPTRRSSDLVDYKVKLEVFEGPLDLLLYLIKRDEVDIYEISIER